MDLPPEILRKIFTYLDGPSFIRCRQVCSVWLDVATNFELTSTNYWKNICVIEITWDFMLNIIEKLFPNYITNNSSAISWKAIYVCWYRWKSLNRWQSRSNELIIPSSGELVCAKFTGNWLLCGTCNFGALVAYDIHNFHMHPRPLIRCCGVIDFVYSNSTSPSSQNSNQFMDNEVMIRTDRAVHWFDIKGKRLVRTAEPYNAHRWLNAVNELMGKKLKSLNPEMQEVKCLTQTENIMMVREYYTENYIVRESMDKDRCWYKPNELHRLLLARWFQLHHNVAMGITTAQCVVFLVNEECKICLRTSNFGNITAALLHSNNFFIASSNGILYHYSIDSLKRFLDFNLLDFDWAMKINEIDNENLIKNIDVCELYDRPYIALAVGKRRIVIIDFNLQ